MYKSEILYIALVNFHSKELFCTSDFQISEKKCKGKFEIPDAIPEGKYILKAHTNAKLMGGRQKVYRSLMIIDTCKKVEMINEKNHAHFIP